MAKKSIVARNHKRENLNKMLSGKRQALKRVIYDKTVSMNERFAAVLKLAKMPRNSALSRVRRRCVITGRPRGVYRKFGLCRNKLREMAGYGLLPGVIKASW